MRFSPLAKKRRRQANNCSALLRGGEEGELVNTPLVKCYFLRAFDPELFDDFELLEVLARFFEPLALTVRPLRPSL